MHISASRATSYKIHLRDFSLDSSFKCRLEMYLWSNLFNGQISVSKTTSPTSPFYFCIRLFSTVHLLLFSASCNDFTEKSCSTLPFPTFTRTEVLQTSYFIQTCTSELRPCRSEGVTFTPQQAGSVQGGRYTQKSASLRRFLGVYWHNLTQTQVSNPPTSSHHLTIISSSSQYQTSASSAAKGNTWKVGSRWSNGVKAAFTKE